MPTTSDDDIRDELRSWLADSEPPFHPDPSVVRRRARKTQGRRAVAASAVAAIVLVGAVATGQTLRTDTAAQDPSTAPDRATFSPDDYVANMERLAGGVTTPFRPQATTAVLAYDNYLSEPIEGDDRRNASRWHGQFLLEDGHVLDIGLSHATTDQPPGDMADFLRKECDNLLAATFMEGTGFTRIPSDTCEVKTRDEDAIQFVERIAKPQSGGWIMLHQGQPESSADRAWFAVGQTWFIQTVRLVRPDFPVTITEAVTASSIEEARSKFAYTRDELVRLAGDESLLFPGPPRNSQGCAWTVAYETACPQS